MRTVERRESLRIARRPPRKVRAPFPSHVARQHERAAVRARREAAHAGLDHLDASARQAEIRGHVRPQRTDTHAPAWARGSRDAISLVMAAAADLLPLLEHDWAKPRPREIERRHEAVVRRRR